MPIPKIKDSRITLTKLEEEYANLGWSKEIEFDWIEMDGRTKRPVLKRYRFNANRIQCDNSDCNEYQLFFIQLRPTGVYWTCGSCRKTDGFISMEEGRELGEFQRMLTTAEAWDILNKSGQHPPVGLDKPARATRNFQIIR